MRSLVALSLLMIASPLAAKDSLGMFSDWGAFRDPAVPRCYAIAIPAPSSLERDFKPYATVASWPRQNVRGQVHFRLSRGTAKGSVVTLQVGQRSFRLSGGGSDAWAKNRTMDAAIVAAMRSASTMIIRATDKRGRRFSNTYSLAGAATAIDAAAIACSSRK